MACVQPCYSLNDYLFLSLDIASQTIFCAGLVYSLPVPKLYLFQSGNPRTEF